MRSIVGVVIVAAVVCACSTSGSGGGGDACSAYAQAIRDGSKTCGHAKVAPEREDEYYARLANACDLALKAPGVGLTTDTISQCATRVREYCGDADACEDLFRGVRGSLAEGAACDSDLQCASGNCVTDSNAQATNGCGKCGAATAVGQPCPNGGCPAGSTCYAESSTSGPSTSKCVAVRRVGEGQPCGSSPTSGTPPDEVDECELGLDCVHESSSSSGVCRAYGAEGDACGESAGGLDCKPDLACIEGHCAARRAAGGACTATGDCQYALACDSSKTCAAVTWGAAGAACDDATKRCLNGFCGTKRVCIDYLAVGAACNGTLSSDQRCDAFSMCANGTCQLDDPARCQ